MPSAEPPAAEPPAADTRYDEAPCALVTTTSEGTVVDANATLARWLGRRVADLRGQRFSALLDARSRVVHETRLAQVLHVEGAVHEAALALAGPAGAVPVLFTAILDRDASLVRIAMLPGSERASYEEELLRARRVAEASEARVRILQDISGAFSTTANDQEVADSFVRIAREAFFATEAAVHLFDDDGVLHRVAGRNPLQGTIAPIPELRDTIDELVLSVDDVRTDFPELAEGLRAAHLEALSITPLRSDTERLGVLVCFFGRARDFDEEFHDLQRALGRQASQTLMRVRLQRELEYLALRDPLTGVLNSQSVERSLREALSVADETSTPLSVIFIDVDAFKAVNDTFGHVAGDYVLRTLARRLSDSVRADDVVGRVGGDEFIAICAQTDAHDAAGIAERIRTHSRDVVLTAAGDVSVSVSIGLASFHPGDRLPTADELLIRADGAMYVSKGSGKDRVSLEERAPSAP